MSATINVYKSKFTIFGSGHDYTLADSGVGEKEPTLLNFSAYAAAIDTTGRYCWMSVFSVSGMSNGMHKFDIYNDWEEVEQEILPVGVEGLLLHPINTSNNIGIAILGNQDVYVFDLTNDTVIAHDTLAERPILNIQMLSSDCYMLGNKVYFINQTNINYRQFYTLDLDNFTLTYSEFNEVIGILDNDSLYTFHGLRWFYDYYYADSYAYDLVTKNWEVMATEPGTYGDVYLPSAFPANNKIYCFTKVGNKWKMGEYNASSAPDFITPSPHKLFGELVIDTTFTPTFLNGVVFSASKTYASFFVENDGLYYTDFNNLYRIEEAADFTPYSQGLPIGMDDHYIVVVDGSRNYIKVYQYR